MMSAAPAIDPMTIPAMAPPDSPWLPDEAAAVDEAALVDDEVGELVLLTVLSEIEAVMVGSTTPAQRVSALEK